MSASDDPEAVARVRAVVPAEVREVCRVLTSAGYQAVTVGGAVRDALLGRDPGDWDVATSAHPDDVQRLFAKTIPTGIAHGTITVVIGKGERRTPVEVTTFRGEGAYSDARRPDTVTFGVPLIEDLARRDLVINAIAYDPIAETFFDPFGGRDDLAAHQVRAVGDAVARFTEDGLRVMRAVRFAAVLEFDLDPVTEAGIAPALPSLRRVSLERVHDELRKLMAAPRPSRGLAIARRAGVVEVILPELAARISDVTWPRVLARVDAAGTAGDLWIPRIAAFLAPLITLSSSSDERTAAAGDVAGAAAVDAALRRLKFANDERDRIVRADRVFPAAYRRWSAPEMRRVLAGVGRARAGDAVGLWRAEASAAGELGDAVVQASADEAVALATRILDDRDPLATGELAVRGADIMSALGIPPGRHVGEILAALLDRVLDDPALNRAETLLALARAVS